MFLMMTSATVHASFHQMCSVWGHVGSSLCRCYGHVVVVLGLDLAA